MDPTATYTAIFASLAASQWDEAREHAANLRAWLDRGGFYPPDSQREQVDETIRDVLRFIRAKTPEPTP